jgi:hypothetical protein
MSDTEEPKPQTPLARQWDWKDPQIILGTLAILAGLAGSVFGVAMAAPFGQDLLCRSFNVSCPRTEFENAKLSINVIDFDGWCGRWLEDMAKESAPPPGYSGSVMDCAYDFSVSEPPGFGGSITFANIEPDGRRVTPDTPGGVKSSNGLLLALHLSMEHPAVLSDTPFTLRVKCSRHDPDIRQWAPVACTLRAPYFSAADPQNEGPLTYLDEPRPPTPDDTDTGTMLTGELDFAQRWRLDIDGRSDALLPPGDYSVEIAVGAPGEPVAPMRIGAAFNVYPPEQ